MVSLEMNGPALADKGGDSSTQFNMNGKKRKDRTDMTWHRERNLLCVLLKVPFRSVGGLCLHMYRM